MAYHIKLRISHILLCLIFFPMVTTAIDVTEPAYGEDLDPIIVERRHCHAMKNVLNDALDLQFDQIIFEYTSVGPDLTTPVRLTASLSMTPKVYTKEVQPRALLLYNEFTTAKHGERTSQNELDDIALYMNKAEKFILLAPDLYGWTLTEDKPQAYCCPEITGIETVDAWDAAMMILEQEGYAYEELPVFNVGYSSGGFSAIAVQKYFNENRPDILFTGTSAGAAPFDITTVFENYVKTNFTGYQCAMPLMMVAYKETYNMPFSYSDIFLPPLSDKIDEWILSKDYGTWDINGLIGLDKKVNEVLSSTACDYSQGIGRDIYLKFRDNSLCGPWTNWQPSKDTDYLIFHSSGDLYMHYFVGLEMANYLTEHGCNVTTNFSDWGNHIDYGIYVYIVQTLLFIENHLQSDQGSIIDETIQSLKDYISQVVESRDEAITAIPTIQFNDDNIESNKQPGSVDMDGYYSLSGEKLNGKPNKGIYIHQGKKMVAW